MTAMKRIPLPPAADPAAKAPPNSAPAEVEPQPPLFSTWQGDAPAEPAPEPWLAAAHDPADAGRVAPIGFRLGFAIIIAMAAVGTIVHFVGLVATIAGMVVVLAALFAWGWWMVGDTIELN